MNDQTSILERARRRSNTTGKAGVMASTTRRCACVLALGLLFLTVGVGSTPSRGTGGQAFTLQATGDPAWADTLADADLERADESGYYEGALSTRARFKTH
jgi:hypothetical protein